MNSQSEKDDHPYRGSQTPLDSLKKTIWLTRPDLRENFEGKPELFEFWLATSGPKDYAALRERLDPDLTPLLTHPAAEAFSDLSPGFTEFMKQVWQTRPDLQTRFNVQTRAGQEGFVWWYVLFGPQELDIGPHLTGEQRKEVTAPDQNLPQLGFLAVTRLMVKVWQVRADLRKTFDLRTSRGQNGFLAWYFTRGLIEFEHALYLNNDQANVLLAPSEDYPEISRILSMIWTQDEDLKARFPELAGPAFRQWVLSPEARQAYPILKKLIEMKRPAGKPKPAVHPKIHALPDGINLIGYARGQLGIGEDVRMAAKAFEAAGTPFSIYNISPGDEVCEGDDSVLCHLSSKLPYATNLFCMTGIETARLAAVYGSKLFDGRRCIGYWPWELPEWPEDWHHAYDLVDEIWASSRFTYDAFVKTSPKPVRHMPMAVTVDQSAGLVRHDFDLAENRFLFVFSFDVLSSLARKNPEACVAAFRKAFPKGDEPVGLVVKAMRAPKDNLVWARLLKQIEEDQRIKLVTGTLDRGAVLDLYRACDCFVSLHRSEGFGRGMAEAMMLGKPVIATGHSGNMDFTLPGTAGVVDHRFAEVGEGAYPFAAGMTWAEPSIDSAAAWMRRLATDALLRTRLAETGKRLVQGAYAPETVGAHYQSALLEHNPNQARARSAK